MVAEILHLTIIKRWPSAIFDFFKFNFFEQLVSSGELIRVIVQNVSKISQTVFEISKIFDF